MTDLYRAIPLPDVWPGNRWTDRRPSPFDANWGGTLKLLAHEIKQLDARDVTLALDIQLSDIRRDGGVRADARIQNPSVILAFTRDGDRFSFPCNRFSFWQDNVRAVALALEALRKVDRYGIQAGRQYEGFKALGGGAVVNRTALYAELAELAGGLLRENDGKNDEPMAPLWLRRARAKHHPDAGGSHDTFTRIGEIAQALGL